MVLKIQTPQTILVIDDDPSIIELLKASLEDLSFVVYSAQDGQTALDFLSKNHVDCLIVDVLMPNMTGPELMVELKNRGNETPFFFITGYLEYSRADLNLYKPRAIMFKPFDFQEAAMLVKNHLMRL